MPFSRLAYGIYLIHYSYLRAFTSQSRTPIYFSEMYFFTIYLGCLFAITLLAAVAFVFIELPFSNLERLVFNNRAENKAKIEIDNQKAINVTEGNTKISLTQCIRILLATINFSFLQLEI